MQMETAVQMVRRGCQPQQLPFVHTPRGVQRSMSGSCICTAKGQWQLAFCASAAGVADGVCCDAGQYSGKCLMVNVHRTGLCLRNALMACYGCTILLHVKGFAVVCCVTRV